MATGAETVVAIWFPSGYLDFPRVRVRGCVEELDAARIPYSRGAGRTRFRWEVVEEGSCYLRLIYRPLDIFLEGN